MKLKRKIAVKLKMMSKKEGNSFWRFTKKRVQVNSKHQSLQHHQVVLNSDKTQSKKIMTPYLIVKDLS